MDPPTRPSPSTTDAADTKNKGSPSRPSFPKLTILPRSTGSATDEARWEFQAPAKRIHEGTDVAHFLTSQAYRDIGIFVLQLNRALCPRRKVPGDGSSSGAGAPASGAAVSFTLGSPRNDPPSVRRLQTLLERAGDLIEEAPPDPGPRRFGNISFRKWQSLLGDNIDTLLKDTIAPEVLAYGKGPAAAPKAEEGDGEQKGEEPGAIEELRAYFLGSFGSSQRLDYGTGHELSFLAFLGCLWKLGAFTDAAADQEGDIERSIVLGVFEPYLKVVRKLILTYTLEPAGSHGVWGLDDHSFMPYIFGSAQLTRPISEDETMPQEGSVLRAPKPGDVTKPATVEVQRELNMYFSAIGFINDVKKGPFWEHSPILFDVSGIKDGWGKINKGMIKMFNAEVLSKFPVVQHFPFGSLFSWNQDPDAPVPSQTVHMANQPIATAALGAGAAATHHPPPPGPRMAGGGGTAAPWAQATRMPNPSTVPGIPYSRMSDPSLGAARTPPPDPVSRQGMGRPGPSRATGAGVVPGEKMEEGSTAKQISLTKAPWARDED